MAPISVPPGATVELTMDGHDFLKQLFEKHDKDHDKALSPQELVNLFSTCPTTPWGPEVYHQAPITDRGYIGMTKLKGGE